MPLDLNLVASTDLYENNRYNGDWGSGYLAAATADILCNVGYGINGAVSDRIADKRLFANQTFNFTPPAGKEITEVSFKSAATGKPATVSGYFSERESLGILTTIGGAGTVSTTTTDTVKGVVASDGTIISGSGFSVSHTATGTYIVTFNPAISTAPSIVCQVRQGSTTCTIFNISTGGFTVVTFVTNTLANADTQFDFIALST